MIKHAVKRRLCALSSLLTMTATTCAATHNTQSTDFQPAEQLHSLPGEPMHDTMQAALFVSDFFDNMIGGRFTIALSPNMSFGPELHVFTFGHHKGYKLSAAIHYAFTSDLHHSGFIFSTGLGYYHGDYKQPVQPNQQRLLENSVTTQLDLTYRYMLSNNINADATVGIEYSDQPLPLSIGHGHYHGRVALSVGYMF